jgi:hypothetical protein
LKKFIEFTKTLLAQMHGKNEYAWFFESFNLQIVNSFFRDGAITSGLYKFQSITESDIGRIKAYLSFIDKKALNYGKVFYQNISDNNLKGELIKDFKEMKVALKSDNIIEFGRRLSLQIENIYNYSLSKLNVHELINSNKDFYSKVPFNWSDNAKSYEYDFFKSFFYLDKEKNLFSPVELSKVSFNTKSVFLLFYFKFKVNKFNLDDIYFLRNKGSHRGDLSHDEKNKLQKIINDFDKNYSYYHKVLFDIVNGVQNIK